MIVFGFRIYVPCLSASTCHASAMPTTTVMAEYNYSPGAYERYIATQNRVSNWISSQSSHSESYPNPFVPSAYQPPRPLPPDDTWPSTKAYYQSRSYPIPPNTAPNVDQLSTDPARLLRTNHGTYSWPDVWDMVRALPVDSGDFLPALELLTSKAAQDFSQQLQGDEMVCFINILDRVSS